MEWGGTTWLVTQGNLNLSARDHLLGTVHSVLKHLQVVVESE